MTLELLLSTCALPVSLFTLLVTFIRTDTLTRRLATVEASLVTARRQIVANRKRVPDARPTMRNREVTKLGRDIDAGVPVNDDIEISERNTLCD